VVRHLLLIDEGPSQMEANVAELARAYSGLQWRRIDWRSLRPESLRREAHVIVPVAVTDPPRAEGLFRWLTQHTLDAATLAVLPEGANALLRLAAEAVDDFVMWPIRPDEWRQRFSRLIGPGDGPNGLHTVLLEAMDRAHLIGSDPALLSTVQNIPRVARTASPVLITGETGTGKELCARTIHYCSNRREYPFVPVDCGAVPDHLFENELFGHSRGAFTDAHGDHKGLVSLAEGGTLFLDEVDSLSSVAQAKLLRFLQERAYKPLGSERFQRADLKIIAAANRPLEPLVRDGAVRSDLFYRLNVMRLHLAPLRDRRADIPLLARHFLERLSAEAGAPRKLLTTAALRKLQAHTWPGNVRELFNVVQRAFVFADGSRILPVHIGVDPGHALEATPDGEDGFRQAKARVLEDFEREYVQRLLRKHDGNVTRAAREAKKERRAFGRLVKKLSIQPSP
jgi:two-component system, NtrC family, response regulator GlrR